MPFHNIGDVVWRACDGLGHWCVSRTAPGKPALVVTTWLESRQSLTADFSQAHQPSLLAPAAAHLALSGLEHSLGFFHWFLGL